LRYYAPVPRYAYRCALDGLENFHQKPALHFTTAIHAVCGFAVAWDGFASRVFVLYADTTTLQQPSILTHLHYFVRLLKKKTTCQ